MVEDVEITLNRVSGIKLAGRAELAGVPSSRRRGLQEVAAAVL